MQVTSLVKSSKITLLVWSAIVLIIVYLAVPETSDAPDLSQPIYDISRAQGSNTTVKEVTFIDATLQSGIVTPHSQKSGEVAGIHESLGAGICTFDVNNDGWLDILVLRGTGNTHYFGKPKWWQKSKNSVSLYRNNRDGSFTDITRDSGLLSNSISMGCAIGDLDSDGDQDIFLANRGKNELWENIGGSSFKQHENFVQENEAHWSTSASIADINGDEELDIYVTNYLDFKPNSLTFEASAGFTQEKGPNFDPALHSGVKNALLLSNGNLSFSNAASSMGVENSQGRGLASTVGDLNDDGRIDLLIANDVNSENKVYLNTGESFTDVSTASSLGITSGTPSILLTNLEESSSDSLFISAGNTKFSRLFRRKDTSKQLKFNDSSDDWKLNTLTAAHEMSWSPAVSDFNMDGFQDVLMVNGLTSPNDDAKQLTQRQPSYLLLNNGAQSFTKQASGIAERTSPVSSARCAVAGDFDNDGSPDVIVANNNGLPQLLLNQNDVANWLGIIIPTSLSAKYSVGMKVEIVTNQRTIRHKLQNGTHGLCWQDNSRFSTPLTIDESVLNVVFNYQGSELGKYSNLIPNQYNLLTTEPSIPISNKEAEKTSNILLESDVAKLTVVELLISEERYEDAFNEIKRLIDSNDSTVREKSAHLGRQLPRPYQTRLAPTLLLSEDDAVQLAGVALIRQTEDDRLARWLFGAVDHDNEQLACAAMETLEYFYAEEEAMVLTKYADLDSLIRNAQGNNIARQQCAIRALGETERYRAASPLIQLLESENATTRQLAIIALGKIRERDAFPALRAQFLARNETHENRLYLLQAMKRVNGASFDETEFIIETLAGSDRATYLASMATAFSTKTENLLNRKAIAKEVKNWYEQTKPALNDLEKLHYLAITQSHQSSLSRTLKQFLAKDSTEVDDTTILLLLKLDKANSNDYLTNLVSRNKLELLSSAPNLGLSKANLLAALSAVNPDTQLNVLELLLPHLTVEARTEYLSELLRKEDAVNSKIKLETALAYSSDSDVDQLCKQIITIFENSKLHTQTISAIHKRWGSQAISNCFKKNSQAQKLEAVTGDLLVSTDTRHIGIELVTPRTEKWARDHVQRHLTDPSIERVDRLHTIKSLRNPPLPSQVKILDGLFKNSSDLDLVIATAQKLANKPQWIEDNAELVEQRISDAIVNKQEQAAAELAKILHSRFPTRALALFLSKDEVKAQ